MTSSPTIAKIAPALVKAQAEMGNAKKDATNPFFKKNYADINSVREAIMPALNAHGICVIQPTTVIDGTTYIETVMLHESGEFISSLTPVVVDKVNDAQRHGSGISYARRYALQSIANIGAEDDDANGATGKVVAAKSVTIAEAIAEIMGAGTLELVAAAWGKYKQFQTDKKFIAAKDQMKSKLTPSTVPA